jgi:proline iminopeptidase
MDVEVNGTRLWYDVDGMALVPDGRRLRARPTVILIHGGPGTYDHSYFKPYFSRLTDYAQVIYLDIRGHGRSENVDPDSWTFEACADDIPAFCAAIGVERPIVLGHSMGGFIAALYAARHPPHPAGLILQSTMARFDLTRLVDGFRQMAGCEVARLAERDYGGAPVGTAEWARVFAAFGPHVPSPDELARRIQHPELADVGMDLMRNLDIVSRLATIACPTLVCVGALDPVTPPAAAEEIATALLQSSAELTVIADAGHFPWLDAPAAYWDRISRFITSVDLATLWS